MAKRPVKKSKPSKFELAVRKHTNDIIQGMYIASSSCHGKNGLPKHQVENCYDVIKTLDPVYHADVTRNVSDRICGTNGVKPITTWQVWICVYYLEQERPDDMLCISETTILNQHDVKAVNHYVSTRVRDMIVENSEDVLNITGFGWCAFPNTEFEIDDETENALNVYFHSCGVYDYDKSNIVLINRNQPEVAL